MSLAVCSGGLAQNAIVNGLRANVNRRSHALLQRHRAGPHRVHVERALGNTDDVSRRVFGKFKDLLLRLLVHSASGHENDRCETTSTLMSALFVQVDLLIISRLRQVKLLVDVSVLRDLDGSGLCTFENC